MDERTQARLEARAEILKALAHPTRLFIVQELTRGERCVCELTEMVDADISTVSKHLSVLKAARIVSSRKDGNMVFYALRLPCVLGFLECADAALITLAREQARLARP